MTYDEALSKLNEMNDILDEIELAKENLKDIRKKINRYAEDLNEYISSLEEIDQDISAIVKRSRKVINE